MNIQKQYAVYRRFSEIFSQKKELFRRRDIDMGEIYEQVSFEFGYMSSTPVKDIVRYVTRNRNSPQFQRAKLLEDGFSYNYFERYDTDEDRVMIEKIADSIRPNTKKTHTASIYYFVFRRYNELLEEHRENLRNRTIMISDIYDILSDEFHYKNSDSIRRIIRIVNKLISDFSDNTKIE
jgi:HD-GYP domain-containing protein (c-di-GMP phosphodiesterase class II)